jgi:hypothetical protein
LSVKALPWTSIIYIYHVSAYVRPHACQVKSLQELLDFSSNIYPPLLFIRYSEFILMEKLIASKSNEKDKQGIDFLSKEIKLIHQDLS